MISPKIEMLPAIAINSSDNSTYDTSPWTSIEAGCKSQKSKIRYAFPHIESG
jgi:hypothetical protein